MKNSNIKISILAKEKILPTMFILLWNLKYPMAPTQNVKAFFTSCEALNEQHALGQA